MPDKPLPPNLDDLPEGTQLIRVGGPIDRACVSLRLQGDSLVPSVVSQLLGCLPTGARQKGDIIPDKRYHRIAKTGMWLLKGDLPESTEIEEQVGALLLRTTSDLEIWRNLTSTLDVDVFCGIFLESFNRGFALTPQITRMLADRGIKVGFDIYGP